MDQNPNYAMLQHFASIPGMQEMLKKQMQLSAGLKAFPEGGFFNAAHAAQRATDQFPSDNYQVRPDSDFFAQWLDLGSKLDPEAQQVKERRLLLEALTSRLMPNLAQQAYERKWNPQLQ